MLFRIECSGVWRSGAGCKANESVSIDATQHMLVTQPGVCFNTILEELCRQNLTLGAYPTSAYTATIGGWIGTGGLVGIGTCLTDHL